MHIASSTSRSTHPLPEAGRQTPSQWGPMRAHRLLLLFLVALTLSGCEAIATIFEAGVWVGVILALIVLGIVGFIASRFRR